MLTKHGEEFDDTYEQEDDGGDATADIDMTKAPANEETFAEFSNNARKFWTEDQKKKQEEKMKQQQAAATENLDEIFEDAEFELKRSNRKKIAALKRHLDGTPMEQEDGLGEEDGQDEHIQADSLNFKVKPNSDAHIASLGTNIGKELAAKEAAAVLPNVDPGNFIEPTKIQGSDLPEIIGYNEQEEEEESQKDLIAEAFADDDVVEDFRAEKDALVAASKPKNIDLTLPGNCNRIYALNRTHDPIILLS